MRTTVTKIASTTNLVSSVPLDMPFEGVATIERKDSDAYLLIGNSLVTSPIVDFDLEFGLIYTTNSVYLIEYV